MFLFCCKPYLSTILRQIRLKIICKVCQIASYIEKGAFYCFPACNLFWDFAVISMTPSAHLGTSTHLRFFSMQIEYWILTCKVLDSMPAISAYSTIFPPSSAAIWLSVANHQAPLYAPMCVLYGPVKLHSRRLKTYRIRFKIAGSGITNTQARRHPLSYLVSTIYNIAVTVNELYAIHA